VNKITELNDDLRAKMFHPNRPGRVVMTQGVQALPVSVKVRALLAIKHFNNFTPDNDPYGEHDFITVKIDNQNVIAKIDYYDKSLEYASEDPSDPEKTTRVMTIMLAEEY
jgi:hypothetical protein